MRMKRLFDSTDDTKTRVIAAATHLFATKGIENVSVRELTSVANVNLAAVNYHFGSKDALYEGVLEAVAANVNSRRLAKLRSILNEAEHAGTLPTLQGILGTFMEPYLGPDQSREGDVLAQLILRDRISRNAMSARILAKHFDPLAREYVAALSIACPRVDPADLFWRYTLMYGAVILTSTDRNKENRLLTMSMGQVDASDSEAMQPQVMNFLVAAMCAPSCPVDPKSALNSAGESDPKRKAKLRAKGKRSS